MELPANKEALKTECNAWLNSKQLQYSELISNAVDAIYNIQRTNQVEPCDLDALGAGLELPHLLSYALGEYCCQLACTHKPIKELILTVSGHRLATTRFNILTLCFYNQPEPMVDTLLKNGLNDKSKKVRQKAIDIICRTNKRNLIDNLLRRLQHEKDIGIIAELQMAHGLMDKGYARCTDIPDRIAIQLPDGGQTTVELANIDINDVAALEKAVLDIREYSIGNTSKVPDVYKLKNID